MQINLENIKLLAFIVLFKKHRRNSLFYKNEKKYLTAKKLNISVNTFSKYLIKLDQLGLITKHSGCLKFSKLSKCIQVLSGKELSEFKALKYVRFMSGVNYKEVSFKSIYQQIQVQLVKMNIDAQNYYNSKIKSAKVLLETNRFISGRASLLKSASALVGGMSELQSIGFSGLHAKTGKYHLSKLLGCSPSTGLNRLRKWKTNNIIERTIVKINLNIPASNAAHDFLKNDYKHLLINGLGKYYIQAGSIISFKVQSTK